MEDRTINLIEDLLNEHVGTIQEEIEQALLEEQDHTVPPMIDELRFAVKAREDFDRWNRKS